MKLLKIKPGDYVKVLNNGAFHSIVQIKNVYDRYIETSHGIYNAETLASRVNRNCIISGIVKWEDQNGVDGLGGLGT